MLLRSLRRVLRRRKLPYATHIRLQQLGLFYFMLDARMALVTLQTHTRAFNGPLSGTTRVSRYQKGKTNLDFSEARDSEWQWHQLGHMQVCTSLQTDNHASTPPLIH